MIAKGLFEDLPKEWTLTPLKEFGSFLKGKGISKSQVVDDGLPCIRYGEIYTSHHFILKEFLSYISKETSKESAQIKKNDILFTGSGETIDEIGKAVAYLSSEEAYAGGDVIILRPQRGRNSTYLSYFLNSIDAIKQKRKLGQGQSIVHIYPSDLKKVMVPEPPIPEQEKIATILSTWDKAIEKVEQLIEAKKKLKKGLMQQLLTGKKRFKEFEGEEWERYKLGDICKITTGKLDANAMDIEGKYLFFTCAKEIYRINKYAFDTEALLISGNGANVGYIHYYSGKFNAYQRTYVLKEFKEDILFVKYQLDIKLKRRIHAEKNAGNTPYIKLGTLSGITIEMPSIECQQRIVKLLNSSDCEIKMLESELRLMRKQKKGLIQQLLTGKIRVKV